MNAPMQRRQTPTTGHPAAPAPARGSAGTSWGGSGQALDKHTQREMSARFGHDFSQVRVHTDARAEESAGALGANAFTLGSDIVFGAGKFVPGSSDTERLLAHELTHVVQQAQWGGPGDWGRLSQRGDASEREAESLAGQVMTGRSVSVQARPGAAVARDENEDSSGGPPPSDRPTFVPDDSPVLPGLKPIPGGDQPPGLENPIEIPKPPPVPFIPVPPPGGFPKPPPMEPAPPASSPGATGGGLWGAIEGLATGLGSFLPPVPRWLFHPEESGPSA